jgi:hypothetical protein
VKKALQISFTDAPHDFFDLFGNEDAPMPYAIVVGKRMMLDAASTLDRKQLRPGAVALQCGPFWIFWQAGDALVGEEGVLSAEMFEGCYQLQETGVWKFLGAS